MDTSAGFFFDSDHPALDLLNTLRWDGEGWTDLLASPEMMAAWLDRAGLLSPRDAGRLASSPPVARLLLDEARGLRAALTDLIPAFARGTVLPEHAIHALNRALEGRRTGVRVVARGVDARVDVTEEGPFPATLLTPLAMAAADLLAEGRRERVRPCDAPDCRLWFYDVSRNGRRRWCSMATCGNRAKVAAHYRRHHGE